MDGGAWKAAVHGVAEDLTRLSDFIFTFHFHALEKEMATHSSVLAWRISGTGEPGRLPSMGSHRVRHDWSDLAAAYIIRWLPLYANTSAEFLSWIAGGCFTTKSISGKATRENQSSSTTPLFYKVETREVELLKVINEDTVGFQKITLLWDSQSSFGI